MPQDDTPQIPAGRTGHRWRYLFGAALVVLVVLVSAPFIYLSHAGGLAGVLQAQLSERLGGVPVKVGDVGVELRLPSMFFTLEAHDVEIDLQDNRIRLPEASAEFSPQRLLTAEPSEVVLTGLDIDLTATADGWQQSPLGVLVATMAARPRDSAAAAGSPRQIKIDAARLTMRHPGPNGDILRFGNVDMSMAVAGDGTFVGSLEGRHEAENGGGGIISLTAIGDFASRDMRLDVASESFSAAVLAPFLPGIPQAVADTGRLSGNASLVVAEARLQAADIDMVSLGGSIDLTPAGLPRLDYDTASVVMGYQRETGRLSLAQGEVTLADGRSVALSGDVDGLNNDIMKLAMRFRGNKWPVNEIYSDWPEGVATKVRTGLIERFAGGNLIDFNIEVAGGYDRSNARLEVVSLTLQSGMRDVLVDIGTRQYERLTGIADGSLDLRLGAGGVVEQLAFSAGVEAGSLELANYPAPLPLNRFQVIASLQGDSVVIDAVSLALADGGNVAISGTLELGSGWKVRAAEFEILGGAIDIRRLHAIWPEWMITKTRTWVGSKMPQGRVEDMRLTARTLFEGNRPRITALDGSITLSDARLELGRKIPAFTDLDGRLTIVDNRGEIILTEGRVEGLELSTGRVGIDPVIGGRPSLGSTDLKLSGDVGNAILVANRLGMARGNGIDLTRIDASGQAELTVRTSFPIRRKLQPGAIDFDVSGTVRNGTFTRLPLSADAREAEFRIAVSKKGFEVRGDARVFGIPSKLAFISRKDDGTGVGRATLDLVTTGSDLERVAEVASQLGVKGFVGVTLSDLRFDGIADVTVKAAFPAGRKVTRSDVVLETAIVVQQARVDGLPGLQSARDVELVGAFSDDMNEISGSAMLFGAPVDFAITENRATDRLVVRANAPNAPGLASLAAATTGLDMTGSLGGSITLATGTSLSDFEIELGLDLADTAIDVPSIGWTKLPAEEGSAAMRIVLKDGRLKAVEDLDINAGSLAVVGRASLNGSGDSAPVITSASFRRLTWPGNDIGSMELTRDTDDNWVITAEADLIDLVPLRRNRGIGEGRPVSFDILAQQIIVGDGISLSGHISGSKKAGGGGKASFAGNLSYKSRPLITESELQLSFGSDGDFLNGVGLVGGAETTLTYSAAKGNVPELTMASENGGGTLGGLRVTDTVRSGEMFLRTRFIDGYDNFNTTIRITNFRVVEAPRAVRAFSVLAPAGLVGLVEGEGTGFAWGEAEIQTRGQKINLTKVTGRGQAVSVAFVGQYDRETREVDVSGNLVPASFLSQIIGVIPIVGEILTGVDNAGLFVTQFSLKGDIDDPDGSVTPASIVPGVLRDLFSPSWLRREGDRILGPQADDLN
ncbi:MAG: AsmA-like C-terminal domain-containing protein [Candidatus Puniceispirillaceae bacterium]